MPVIVNNVCLQALIYNMSKKTSSSEGLTASNVATGSPLNKRMKDRNDFTATAAATQPSDELMNALFEQVAVRPTAVYTLSHATTFHITEKPEHVKQADG